MGDYMLITSEIVLKDKSILPVTDELHILVVDWFAQPDFEKVLAKYGYAVTNELVLEINQKINDWLYLHEQNVVLFCVRVSYADSSPEDEIIFTFQVI